MSVIAECPGYLKVFSDGHVERFAPEIAVASPESSNGYKSKDVTIDSSKPITGRIFLPDVPQTISRLPVLVYFHGGGFCIGSTTWLGYHVFLGDLSVISQCIILSVDYRLAPENKLPIAYDDAYYSLEWLTKNITTEPWLQRADLSCVFLSGDSAGGNIVHQVAIKAVRSKNLGLTIKGLLPIHPYFGSQKRTTLENADNSAEHVSSNDMFWNLSLPEGEDRDYPGSNFEKAELLAEEWIQFPQVVVFIAELDFLKERGVMYAEFLQKKGVRKVKLIEAKGESHIHHIFHPDSEATCLLQKQMRDFIHGLWSPTNI